MNKVFTPEEILPTGDDFTIAVNPFTGHSGKARKGTVAATLNNIALLDRLLLNDTETDHNQINLIKEAITSLIPSLKAIGIFDLFHIEDWIKDKNHLGKICTAVLYLKQYPCEVTEQIRVKLNLIEKNTTSLLLHCELHSLKKS